VIPTNSPFRPYLSEFDWHVDERGRLFTQINQSELLNEFMNMILSSVETKENSRMQAPDTPAEVPPKNEDIYSAQPAQVAPPNQQEPSSGTSHNVSPAAVVNWPAWIFGGVLVLFFMGLIWFKPQQLNQQQDKLLRILSSVFVGVMCGFFTGNLKLEGKVPVLNDLQIGALGGFAGFALVFLSW
jgi:hypothetical protein